MAPRKGSSPFSRVESPLLLDPEKKWYVLSSKVCGESAAKYFSRNKLPARFPDDIVRVKRSALRTVDGDTFEGKASSEDEIVASSFGMIAIFLRHSPDSGVFKENAFERLRDYLNCLDLSVLSQEEQEQADVAFTNVARNVTPVVKTNRRLEMPPTSTVVYSERMDEDTGCFLLTPPKSKGKKVSRFQLRMPLRCSV